MKMIPFQSDPVSKGDWPTYRAQMEYYDPPTPSPSVDVPTREIWFTVGADVHSVRVTPVDTTVPADGVSWDGPLITTKGYLYTFNLVCDKCGGTVELESPKPKDERTGNACPVCGASYTVRWDFTDRSTLDAIDR